MAGKARMSKVPGRLEVWKTKLTVGQMFGYWKVLPDPQDPDNIWFSGQAKEGTILVRCECTSCGSTFEQRPSYLISNKTKSCRSCARKKLRTGALNYWSWKGYEEIEGSVLSNLKAGAKRRGIEVDITLKDIWDIYIQQDRKCWYTGLPVSFEKDGDCNRVNSDNATRTASIDRIDSSKGYTKDNIRIVHQMVNIMKNVYPEERFIEMCSLVTAHHGNQSSLKA